MNFLTNENVKAAEIAAEEAKKERLPVGPHVCAITEVELKNTKKGGNPMIVFTMEKDDSHYELKEYVFWYKEPKDEKQEKNNTNKFKRYVSIVTKGCGKHLPAIPKKVGEGSIEDQVKWLYQFALKETVEEKLQVMVRQKTEPYEKHKDDGSSFTKMTTKAEPAFFGSVDEDMSNYDLSSLTEVITVKQVAQLNRSPKPIVDTQQSNEDWVD